MLLWIKVLAFLKNTTMDLATFVAVMIDRIARFVDILIFLVIMRVVAILPHLGPRTRATAT